MPLKIFFLVFLNDIISVFKRLVLREIIFTYLLKQRQDIFLRKSCRYVKALLQNNFFKQFPELEEELWGGHFWSEGGHIDTVGDGYDVREMEKYILSQGVSKSQMKLYQFLSTSVDEESPSRKSA